MKSPRKKSKFNLKSIVMKFCSVPIDWPHEMKMAKQLINDYPDNCFWQSLIKPKKCKSLVFFLTFEGQNYLKSSIKLGNLNIMKDDPIPLNETSVIDIKIEPKPKTVLDFLRKDYGKN